MPKRTKRNPDHVKQHNTPTIDNEAIANQLKALLTPIHWVEAFIIFVFLRKLSTRKLTLLLA